VRAGADGIARHRHVHAESLAAGPGWKERGLIVTDSTPEEFDAHMRKSLKLFADSVKAAKVTVN
jgi:hypothetical protein